MKTNQIIGQNIKMLRKGIELTQQDFAHYLGITREEVSYYETGARTIPSEIISKAAKLFAVDEYDLYEDNPATAKLHIAFAFRATKLHEKDLESIAQFRQVTMNYLKMKKALATHE